MDARTLAGWRMHTLLLAGELYATPEAVVQGLLGVQAEIRPQASWAVATRTPGAVEDDISRLLDDGVILRTHVLRSTWHFVLPGDIRWLVELTAPRVMVVVDGQMVGGMKRTVRGDELRFDVRPYRELDAGEREAVQEAADRYGAFLGRKARVEVGAG